MGQKVSRTDFEWVYTDEPHASRRKIILEKYPQIKKLFGHDPNLKYVVSAMVFTQFAMLFIMKDQSWPITLLVAYCFGGVINSSLGVAIHEIAHNMAFGNARPMANRLFGMFCNLPLGLPASITFKKYHADHHRYLGVDGVDPDLPTFLETMFCTKFGKFCFVFLQPLFFVMRPMFAKYKPINRLEIINAIIQLIFDAIVVYFFGWRELWYLVLGTWMAMGLHPLGGHYIAEHYMFATHSENK